MSESELTIITADRDREIFDGAQSLVGEAFPEFMNHSAVINSKWKYLYRYWSKWQFILLDKDSNICALVNCFPLYYDGSFDILPDGGIEWALSEAVLQFEKGIAPNIACAFQIIIGGGYLGRGLSYRCVEEMIALAKRMGMVCLVAPVRPNRKSHFPDMTFSDYTGLRRDDGLPFDDWIRVHVRLGGEIANICTHSFIAEAGLDDWRRWTGLALNKDGPQQVEGGLVPVEISTAGGKGVYTEPNIWIRHMLTGDSD